MADNAATILHTQLNGVVEHLRLTHVLIDATVVDVSAHIVVFHTFKNDSENATGRAKYVFPVPARATVCAFEMKTSDGKFVVGEVKEKTEAEARYRTAVDAGKMAGMVNWAGDDVFTISIGSIRDRSSVTAKTTFVITLMDNSRVDEIRLQLPVSIGSARRYGQPLPEAQDADSPEITTRVRFSASIQTSGRLVDVRSPSHKEAVEITIPPADQGGTSSPHCAYASFSSPSFLSDDFVVVIRSEALDAPRCFAEEDEQHRTVALQLTVTPKFNIPRPPMQEYLFLVDRSTSMRGRPIEMAKQALKLLLHVLPAKGSYVNIFSFSGDCDDGLWPTSQSYSPTCLHAATMHIEKMAANSPGTEIRVAVSKVLDSRMISLPTIVYVLTDGLVMQPEIDATVAAVRSSVQQASTSDTLAPLRVFTLGIGNEVSTSLCEGIAHAGRGVSLFAADSSEIRASCARLVVAGIHPVVTNISVDWGATLTEDEPTTDEILGVQLQPHSAILQSPPRLTTLYRNHRFVVYAILRTHIIPRTVILRGKVQDGQTEQIELTVPVIRATRFSSLVYTSAFLHTLTARSIIRDLRSGQCIPECDTRREIIRLGMRYQLASEFTSFVGVDEGETVEALRTAWRKRLAERRGYPTDPVSSAAAKFWGFVTNIPGELWRFVRFGGARKQPPIVTPTPTRSGNRNINVPGQFSIPSPSPSRSSRSSRARSDASNAGQEGSEDGYWVDDTVSTVSSLASHDSVRVFRPTRQRWMRRPKPPVPRAPSPDIHITSHPGPPTLSVRSHPAPRTEDLGLIQLQAWDGSFHATENLMGVMGRDMATEAAVAAQLGVEEDIWATILVIEYLAHKLQDEPELLDGLLMKVLEFAESTIDRARFEELRAHARGLLVTS